jgi:hypothetical protein
MSGVNPTAAGASASAVEAAIALELQALAADAQALRALLMTGDVVQATVQPFNGLTDTVEILGLKVAAALPPDVVPGDTLTVAVGGFNGDQVLVQVLSRTPLSQEPASAQVPASAAAPAVTTSQGDSLELTRSPIPIVVEGPPESLPPPLATASSEPPRAIVVAASESTAPPAMSAPPARPLLTDAPIRPEDLDVEARVALARTAGFRALRSPNASPASATPAVPRGATPSSPLARGETQPQTQMQQPPLQQSTPPRLQAQSMPPSLQAQTATTTPARSQRESDTPQTENPIAPPPPTIQITPRAPGAKPPPPPLPGAPTQMRVARMVPQSPRAIVAPTAAELLQDAPALLRTLRIPVTPTTLTFAKLVTTQPEQVATALRALETSLPDNADLRIGSLRTLAAFVGALDPQSPTFTTQVVSYIAHVVEGPEQKLVPLVLPQAAAADPQVPQEPVPAPAQASPPAPHAAAAPAPAEDPSVSAAHVAERTAAADADLKTQLIGVLASPQAETALGEAGVAVARNALTALVATQLNAIVAQQAQPGTWSFTVPIAIEQQLYPAKIEISRDKEGERKEISNDDFHIVFILDTKRLGTVAVDVHAVQRAVSVSVRTERTTAAATFKAALKNLGMRLEQMRYNVKSLEAAAAKPKEAPSPPSDPLTQTDNRA